LHGGRRVARTQNVQPSTEKCDGVNNDCDDLTDEAATASDGTVQSYY
jgi:hypothetical protein